MKNPNIDDVLTQFTDLIDAGRQHETVLVEAIRAVAALSNIKAQIDAARGGQIAVPKPGVAVSR